MNSELLCSGLSSYYQTCNTCAKKKKIQTKCFKNVLLKHIWIKNTKCLREGIFQNIFEKLK